MTDGQSSSGKLVFLNVGGQVFQTTLATLQGGSSMLSKMFSGQMEPGLRDEEGRVYIDRDPKHFGVILNSMRCGGAADAAAKLLPTGRAEQRELLLEAQYYGCEGLVAAIEASEQEWVHSQALELKRLAAAAAIDSSRAAMLREAEDVEAVAAETLHQARIELEALAADAELLVAGATGAAAADRAGHVSTATRLAARSSEARERGRWAAQQLLAARVLRLATLGGGAERAAAALWRRERADAAEELSKAHSRIDRSMRRALNANWPPGLRDPRADEELWDQRDHGRFAGLELRLARLERALEPHGARRPQAALRPARAAAAPAVAVARAAPAAAAAAAVAAQPVPAGGAPDVPAGAAAPGPPRLAPAAGGGAVAGAGVQQFRGAVGNQHGGVLGFWEAAAMGAQFDVGLPLPWLEDDEPPGLEDDEPPGLEDDEPPGLEDDSDEDWVPGLLDDRSDGSDEED